MPLRCLKSLAMPLVASTVISLGGCAWLQYYPDRNSGAHPVTADCPRPTDSHAQDNSPRSGALSAPVHPLEKPGFLRNGWLALQQGDTRTLARWVKVRIPDEEWTDQEKSLYAGLRASAEKLLRQAREHEKLVARNQLLEQRVREYRQAIEALTRIEQDLSERTTP